MKCFTENAVPNFKKAIKRHIANRKEGKHRNSSNYEQDAEKKCFDEFLKYEDKFMNLVEFLL